MRKTKFTNNEYYHIYNRGIDKRKIFLDEADYERFLLSINLLNDEKDGLMAVWKDLKKTKKTNPRAKLLDTIRELSSGKHLVEITVYCFNPNHKHFILKQLVDKGVERFMHKLGTSYTNYFNKKNNRSGSLFQGPFKSIHINTNEYLLWLSGYINGNPEIHKIAKAENWQWSSYPDYLGLRNGTLSSKKIILDQFPNSEEYKRFVEMVIKEARERKDLEKYLLE